MKREIYVFRHGETDFNVQHRMQGYLDIPLNDNGIAQAHNLADKLSNVNLDCIYTSPLSRALNTAKIVAEKNHTKVICDAGLQEWNLGVFCGHIVHVTDEPKDTPFDLSSDTIYIPFALISDDDFVPENGESYNMFAKRVYDAILNIMKNTDAQNIGIATHGGVVKVLVRTLTNWKLMRGGMPNAGYFKMQWDGERLVVPEKPDWLIESESKNIAY